MKSSGLNYHNKKIKGLIHSLGCSNWNKCLMVLLAMQLLLGTANIEAAQIIFEPNGVSVNAAPGEVVSLPMSVTLSGVSGLNSFAKFNLTQIDGNLNQGWISSSLLFSLSSWYMTRSTVLKISVPTTANGGHYTGVFSPTNLTASDAIDPVSFEINVNVNKLVTCNRVPEFLDVHSAQDAIQTKSNKLVPIDLSGSVLATEGCTLLKLEYHLVDEYGDLDHSENVDIADDGTFEVSIPMIASRKGDDKDGRLYSVHFTAENEAGVAESAETRIVVMHDNRKE